MDPIWIVGISFVVIFAIGAAIPSSWFWPVFFVLGFTTLCVAVYLGDPVAQTVLIIFAAIAAWLVVCALMPRCTEDDGEQP